MRGTEHKEWKIDKSCLGPAAAPTEASEVDRGRGA